MNPADRQAARAGILSSRGIPSELHPLVLASSGTPSMADFHFQWPTEEPMAGDWEEFLTAEDSAWNVLLSCYPPLRFPVSNGMSDSPDYQQARKSGISDGMVTTSTEPLSGDIALHLRETIAGRLPVLQISERKDFDRILQSLCHRNEPVPIPPTQGAALLGGLLNHRRAAKNRLTGLPLEKPAYQDCLCIVSSGPYSALPASALEYENEEAWLLESILIRTAHESAHYLTKRIFGLMRRAIFDEFIADAYALLEKDGKFSSNHLCILLGIDQPCGRFKNYFDDPENLLADSFRALIRDAATALETLLNSTDLILDLPPVAQRGYFLAALYPMSLEELLLPNAAENWRTALRNLPPSPNF